MEEQQSRVPRKRVANFTADEKTLLKILIKKMPIVESKLTDGKSVAKKQAAWKFITKEFNRSANNVPKRETITLKRAWDNMKAYTRKARAAKRGSLIKTESISPEPSPTPEHIDIFNMVEEDAPVLTYEIKHSFDNEGTIFNQINNSQVELKTEPNENPCPVPNENPCPVPIETIGMRVELGKVPDDVFFKDPTKYSNLYDKFKWKQVTRRLHITKLVIEDIINKEEKLFVHLHSNDLNKTIFVNASLFDNVENTLESSWSKKGMPKEDIFYDMYVEIENNRKKLNFNWRNKNLFSYLTKFGVDQNGFVELKPNQTIAFLLKATKTIFVFQVHYKAYLYGHIIADYDYLYGKYHFYAPTVANILKAANITNEINTKEVIEIRCYTNPVLLVYDKATRKEIKIIEYKRQILQDLILNRYSKQK